MHKKQAGAMQNSARRGSGDNDLLPLRQGFSRRCRSLCPLCEMAERSPLPVMIGGIPANELSDQVVAEFGDDLRGMIEDFDELEDE